VEAANHAIWCDAPSVRWRTDSRSDAAHTLTSPELKGSQADVVGGFRRRVAHRSHVMKILVLLLAAAALGCSSMSYRPVQETNFDRLVKEGCTRKGDRFAVNAQVNSASRETIVLWDGYDGSRTIAVRLPSEGVGSRMRGVFGKSRYELGLERLNELRIAGAPVDVTMRCERAGAAPEADRFSYFENGQRVQFEF
jgi:hypothetical protein